MIKKIFLLTVFIAGSYCTYAQKEKATNVQTILATDSFEQTMDKIIEYYEKYFSLNKQEKPINKHEYQVNKPKEPVTKPENTETKPEYPVTKSDVYKPVSAPVCPPEPDNFHDSFNQKFVDFASLRENEKVKTFSFNDSLHSPLKQDLTVTSEYGMRNKKKHLGVDFRLNIGDTVCSVFCGKVRVAKWDDTYGYVVVVRHYNMSETVYAHLEKILVDINQKVEVGEPIALGGNTGRSNGPHLHFELRYKGFPINPIINEAFLTHIPVVIAD